MLAIVCCIRQIFIHTYSKICTVHCTTTSNISFEIMVLLLHKLLQNIAHGKNVSPNLASSVIFITHTHIYIIMCAITNTETD